MRDKIRKVMIIVLTAVAVGCAGYLIWYYMVADKVEDSYEEARKAVEETPENIVEEPEQTPEIPINFDELKAVNPDVYAWIRIEGTGIDYPIVQKREDDMYYLNHTWEGKEAPEGAIFTQACNAREFTDFNTVVYGHQMGEGVETMFHNLNLYLNEGFMEEHPDIIVYTPDKIRTYRVFAAVIYDDRHLMQYFNYIMDAERQAFLDSLYNSRDMRNRFREDVVVSIEDHILSLSTCVASEPNHRLLVEAVLKDEK